MQKTLYLTLVPATKDFCLSFFLKNKFPGRGRFSYGSFVVDEHK